MAGEFGGIQRWAPATGSGRTDAPPAGPDDRAALDCLNGGAYRSGLANLKKVLESQ